MSRVETDQVPFPDELLPEILRRLLVEELWARRHVLAELMNAERIKIYTARRSLIWPTRVPAMDMVWKDPLAKPSATIVPIRNRKAFVPGA